MSTAIFAAEEMEQTIAATTPDKLLSAGPIPRDSGDWFSALQAQAWERFESIPMPLRTDEAWRFASLKKIDLTPYSQPAPLDAAQGAALVARSISLPEIAGRLIFGNDQLLACEERTELLRQKGVIWMPLEQALLEHSELVQKHFMREEAILGSKKFAALHQSQVRAGTFLYVPRGVEIELPLEAFHWLAGEGSSCFPHSLIIAEDRSKVTLVDYFQSSSPDTAGFACGMNDLSVGAGASVTYVCLQNWNPKTLSFQINSTIVGRDARAVSLNLNLGSSLARTESVSRLRGEGSRSDMLAVSVADNAQELDQRTLQVHEVAHTCSDLLYKNSLDDSARTIFAGLIRVEPGAHQTDAYQKVRNLLLSDESEANSAPGLEIEADDVRCSHGATTGQIDAEELFYLLSRGITRKEAQKLIVHGFLQEVIDRLGNAPIAEKLSEFVHAKFDTKVRAS